MKYIISILIILLSGCSYPITDINVSNKDKNCVRECSESYSSCVKVGITSNILKSCRESYLVCTNTCDIVNK